MQGFRKSKGMTFTPFRSAAEEAATKRGNHLTSPGQQLSNREGRGVNSAANRITCTRGAELPYAVVLATTASGRGEHSFATMREAEDFMSRNAPAPDRALSTLYDRPAGG
jgi:hypothetical protein